MPRLRFVTLSNKEMRKLLTPLVLITLSGILRGTWCGATPVKILFDTDMQTLDPNHPRRCI